MKKSHLVSMTAFVAVVTLVLIIFSCCWLFNALCVDMTGYIAGDNIAYNKGIIGNDNDELYEARLEMQHSSNILLATAARITLFARLAITTSLFGLSAWGILTSRRLAIYWLKKANKAKAKTKSESYIRFAAK